MNQRFIFTCLLGVFLSVATPVQATVGVETYTSGNGANIHHILRTDTQTEVPPQDVLVMSEDVFGELPDKVPGEMEKIVEFFDQLPERINLHTYRGRDRDGDVKFGSLKTKDHDAFLSSLEVEGVPVRDTKEAFRNVVEQWPGDGNRPGVILMLTREVPTGSFEIPPSLIQSLTERKILVHNLAMVPSDDGTNSSMAQLTRLSGGQRLTTGDMLNKPRLPETYAGADDYREKVNTIVASEGADTALRKKFVTNVRRALARLLPVHAHNPSVKESNKNKRRVEPDGYAWTGRMPLVISSTPPVEELSIVDGGRSLNSVSIPRSRPGTFSRSHIKLIKLLKRMSLKRRELIYGLTSKERRWMNWIDETRASAGGNPGREVSASDVVSFLTGRVAIGESFQIEDWQPTQGSEGERSVPIGELEGPELQHLDYDDMIADGADTQRFPLTEWAPEDMAVLSFTSVDSALASGDLFEYWSSDIVDHYLDETGSELIKTRFLDRLGIKMNRDMRPFYNLAVGEVGFFINEPSLGATQDVALAMTVKNRELVERRLEQIRSKLRESYPAVSMSETSISVNDQDLPITVFRTPDRRISSHVMFHDSGLVMATSKKTLKRIARVKTGETRSLSTRSDVRYLSQTLEPSSGYLVISDSFVSKIIKPEWRLKYDRRARCLNKLDRLSARTSFHRAMFGSFDTTPRSGLCSPGRAVKWESGRWVSPVYGHRQFATPIGEITISKITEQEHARYRQFSEQYQDQWQRAVDPIGISLDVSSDTFADLKTVILPLVNQSRYNQLLELVRGSVSVPIDSRRSLPSRTVFGALFANPYAQYERGDADTSVNRFRQWEQYKQRMRDRLDWPDDQPMLDWLGEEWGLVAFDLAPEDLAGMFSGNAMGAVTRIFSQVPIAIYTDVNDESKANYFLKVLKESRESRGRPGFRLRKRQVDGRPVYSTNIFGIQLFIGVRAGKLFISLDREFLVPSDDKTLADRSNFNSMVERSHRKSQGLFFFQLDQATGLKRFLNPALYPLERWECRRARANADRTQARAGERRKGPFGGEWFKGPSGSTFCKKHSSYSNQTFWERLMKTGQYPVLSDGFQLKQKLDRLDNAIISFEISPTEYSVIVSLENPVSE